MSFVRDTHNVFEEITKDVSVLIYIFFRELLLFILPPLITYTISLCTHLTSVNQNVSM